MKQVSSGVRETWGRGQTLCFPCSSKGNRENALEKEEAHCIGEIATTPLKETKDTT